MICYFIRSASTDSKLLGRLQNASAELGTRQRYAFSSPFYEEYEQTEKGRISNKYEKYCIIREALKGVLIVLDESLLII